MQEVLEFLGAGLAGGAAVALLLGLAAWKWKALVSHWLLKDIEAIKANHQQQLEEKKAQYQRELESYRTSLIAYAESVKAGQEVKKAMAISIANKRFQAIDRLHGVTEGLGIRFFTLYRRRHLQEDRIFEQIFDEIQRKSDELGLAAKAASPFLGPSKTVVLLNLHEAITEGLYRILERGRGSPPDADIEAMQAKMSGLQSAVDDIVHREIESMFRMSSGEDRNSSGR